MPADDTSILTIGYGQRDIADFLALLARYGIAYLGDVRSRPASRFNPDFSRDALREHLRLAGITYVFLGDTLGGDPDDPAVRRALRSGDEASYAVDYELVRQQPGFQRGMERLRTARERGVRLALMCSEGKSELCHRSRLIGVALEDEGIPVGHIDEAGVLRTQREIMRRIDKGQELLPGFGASGKATRSSCAWRVRDDG